MKYILVIILITTFNLTTINAQIEVGFKTGIQMLGMFRSSPNIFGDGDKVFNLDYGFNIGHKIGKNLDLSLDADYTAGNYYKLKQNRRIYTEKWNRANYSLFNLSGLLTYKIKKGLGIRSGLHVFFIRKISTETNSIGFIHPPYNRSFRETFSSSRTIGIPLGLVLDKNHFELEIKWVGGLRKYSRFETGYYRLETLSINLYYNFKLKK